MTSIRKSAGIIALLLWVTVSGCEGRGTNESASYGAAPRAAQTNVNFETLRSEVLQTSCMGCHKEFASDSGLSAYLQAGDPNSSRLYQVIRDGEMPPSGPRLSPYRLALVNSYISGLGHGVPPTGPAPIPAVPDFAFIRTRIMLVSCAQCHDPAPASEPPSARKRPHPLETYEQVREDASDIADAMDLAADPDHPGAGDVKPMPPKRFAGTRPTPELRAAFRAWMQAGYPR